MWPFLSGGGSLGGFLMMIVRVEGKKPCWHKELDAVSRADFTSRHLFQVDAQT
jgi:hypothetical protein